ncbi:hypothetical protein ABEB36_007262 [Hypothenemus hampei]|uniref:10 kDa heat shock protein, mitochondrial n=1 Tax=Hypothenemus hampei TaxID=57062 RepID=A0ABD1ETG9_HYPHA
MASQALPKTVHKLKTVVPLFNRLLVKRAELPTESKGGIVLPESSKIKSPQGTVVAVGPGIRNEKGVQIPMSVKVGDKVMLPEYGGTKVEIEQETYFLFKESEILAKFCE